MLCCQLSQLLPPLPVKVSYNVHMSLHHTHVRSNFVTELCVYRNGIIMLAVWTSEGNITCLFASVCICMHVYGLARYIRQGMYVCIHVYMCVHVCVYLCVHVCVCVNICVSMCVYACACVHVFMYIVTNNTYGSHSWKSPDKD